jgi:hypothetical protein
MISTISKTDLNHFKGDFPFNSKYTSLIIFEYNLDFSTRDLYNCIMTQVSTYPITDAVPDPDRLPQNSYSPNTYPNLKYGVNCRGEKVRAGTGKGRSSPNHYARILLSCFWKFYLSGAA